MNETPAQTCSEDCDKPVYCKGWCKTHYGRWRRTGDPNKLLRVPAHDLSSRTKKCRRCERVLPLDKFDRHVSATNGRKYIAARCKDCRNELARAKVAEDSELRQAKQRQWYGKQADEPGWLEQRNLKQRLRKYGLTLADLEELEPICAVCSSALDFLQGGHAWVIDHDHSNGQRRKPLCKRCNTLLGLAGDDPELLRRAAAYIEAHR